MSKDIEGYVWVLLTKVGSTIYVHGIYPTYYELQTTIRDIEQQSSLCKIYSYEQVPL